ncbi:MAG TPA: hypothetical protein VFY84_00630 [Jiangellales bacterium]|nr:hypothetical protein [Jiangellales bacterium]
MSMVFYLVKVTPAVAEKIRAEPDLLPQVWREIELTDPDIAAISDSDRLMEDYLHIGERFVDHPGRYPWMERALSGTGTQIAFEFGYGPGFFVTPDEAGKIATGLAEEGSWKPGQPVEWVDDAIAAFYTTAHAEGKSIIGGVG